MNDKRVEVYWNLHKHCYSVRSLEGDTKGRVISHTEALSISNVTFSVQPAGRRRVLSDRVKNVHAFVRGQVVETPPSSLWSKETRSQLTTTSLDDNCWLRVAYNPYKAAHFVTDEGEAVHSAQLVHCVIGDNGKSKMYAYGAEVAPSE